MAMMLDLSEVTAVVTCFNAGPELHAAVDSIVAEGPLGIILVDDGSSQCACSEMSVRRLAHLHRANGGHGAALNSGVAAVDTPFIAFLDADDLWMAGKARRQLSLLQVSGADCVAGGVINLDTRGGRVRESDVIPHARVLGSTTFRVDALRRVGPFDEGPGLHGIIDWWSRALSAGITVVEDPEPALRRRIHGLNSSLVDADGSRSDLLRHLRGHIVRRSPT